MNGLDLFTNDVKSFFAQFREPQFVIRSRKEEYTRELVLVSSEIKYWYGDYEIFIRCHSWETFISIQNLWTMKYLTFTAHEQLDHIAVAKQLIKANKKLFKK